MFVVENIPAELRAYPQWVTWRYEAPNGELKPTKVPYSPRTGAHASSTDARTWATFDEAIAAAPNYSGIGFVLSVDDPFAFIDLDDTNGDAQLFARQKGIHDTFNSYSEFSPSGKGVHIILKGHVQSGRKRAKVEVYSAMRFMTVTGNVLNKAPIEERQYYLEILWKEIGKEYDSYTVTGTLEQSEDDAAIIARGISAANGDKFKALYNGEWQGVYPSQSEADFALIDIVAFYTQNRNQIRNIFAASGLGQRSKARRFDYVEKMISRAFDRQIPQLDFEGLQNNLMQRLAETEAARNPIVNVLGGQPHLELPPGLIGDIARFIYSASPRPVMDISLMAAIGLMAGICGRAYNISGTGLNQYLLLLARTGRGKEAMSAGIDKLLSSIRVKVPSVVDFVGPGDIASGQSLIKYMAAHSASFVSIIGEFDKLLASLSSSRANSAMIMLRKCILDMYGKSGFGQTYRPMIYSDEKKSTSTILSPAFSILGECTPEKFYELVDESQIADGLLPRFLVIEYLGDRHDLNVTHMNAEPDEELCNSLSSITMASLLLLKGQDGIFRCVNVKVDAKAQPLIDQFNTFCDTQINSSSRDAIAQLWSRAYLKMMKLAALVAIGATGPYDPIITYDVAAWSMRFVDRDVRNILSHFDAGEIGSDESKQLSEVRKVVSEYIHDDYSKVARYQVPRNLHAAKIIPHSYLSRRLLNIACFRKDRLGRPNEALTRVIRILLDQAELAEVNREQLQREYGSGGKSYIVKEMAL